MKKRSRNWNANYFGVAANEGIADDCGAADGRSIAVSVGHGATDGVAVGNDAGDAWDDVAGRSLESGVS